MAEIKTGMVHPSRFSCFMSGFRKPTVLQFTIWLTALSRVVFLYQNNVWYPCQDIGLLFCFMESRASSAWTYRNVRLILILTCAFRICTCGWERWSDCYILLSYMMECSVVPRYCCSIHQQGVFFPRATMCTWEQPGPDEPDEHCFSIVPAAYGKQHKGDQQTVACCWTAG